MLDQTAPETPGLSGVRAEILALHHSSSFSELRNALHALALPSGFKVYGPVLVSDGARIDITDTFFRTIETVTLVVPEAWHDSDW